jgi:predicted metallopeptidase
MARSRRRVETQVSAARTGISRFSLLHEWTGEDGSRPLPVRSIRPLRTLPKPVSSSNFHPGLLGLAPEPFHFTRHMHALCMDIVARTPALQHILMQHVLTGITRARTRRSYGLQAKVTPMRFAHGKLLQRRRGWMYQVQQYYVAGVEMLYLMSFCLPRYLDLCFEEKMITIFHELFHIAPEFNGDLRRHSGRYYQHTHSKKKYDAQMKTYVEAYLAAEPHPALYGFLRHSFEELHERHGRVLGVIVPAPKLVPLIS